MSVIKRAAGAASAVMPWHMGIRTHRFLVGEGVVLWFRRGAWLGVSGAAGSGASVPRTSGRTRLGG